ncbi:MAG: site-2 protease family protein [Chloroflexi bacterium]|nr:site-2 protease family protein [Chloroflexota bacterium]
MKPTIRLGKIAGLQIGVHYTLLLAVALITWTLAEGFFPDAFPGWSRVAYWLTSVVAALLLFVSVLVHEMAHSLVARSRGLPVEGITLFLFGGISSLSAESRSAGEEFVVAVVGPLSSLVLAVLFGAAYLASSGNNSPVTAVLAYLALVNGMLGLFNLLPGFPLDGGRVLRAAIWGATHNLYKATRVASTIGQAVAFAFIAWGVFQVLTGDVLGGLWIAFIGWFLNGAAESSRQETSVQEALRGVRVAEVMDHHPETTSPSMGVDVLVREFFLHHGKRALPVEEVGQLVGIVTITDAKEVPPDRWPFTRVSQIMTTSPLYSVTPDSTVAEALRSLAERRLNQLLVMSNGSIVGMISRENIIQYLQLMSDYGVWKKPGILQRLGQ